MKNTRITWNNAFSAVTKGFIIVFLLITANTSAATYYISSSSGNDAASGKSEARAWKTLARASQQTFGPGDRILLKCGDTWYNDTFRPTGSGTPDNPILVSYFGDGNKPVLDGLDEMQDREGIHLVDVEGYKIVGLEITRYRSGIFAHYGADRETKRYLWIEDCYIHDSNFYTQYQDYLKNKPSLGIIIWTDEIKQRIAVSDITIRNCRFERLLSAIWTNTPDNFTIDADSIYNFSNLVIEDCIVEEGKQWQIGIRNVNGGVIRNSVFHDTGRRFQAFNGVAGSMIQRSRDLLFEDCEFGFVSIGEKGRVSADGEAFDFEIDNCDITVRNCLFHDTDGPGILICYGTSSAANNRRITMENCVLNGKAMRVDENWYPRIEIYNASQANEVHWKDCRFYLAGRVSLTNYEGWMTFTDCLTKPLNKAHQTENLAVKATASASSNLMASGPELANDGKLETSWLPEETEGAWLELRFDKPTAINEFKICEHPNSTITRYTIEYWDMEDERWRSCFNGSAITGRAIVVKNSRAGMGFTAPIVERTTDRVRLVVNRTETGRCRIDEFEAYHDLTPYPRLGIDVWYTLPDAE